MGMFDRVYGMPLPDGFKPTDGELQTKDLDNELDNYDIRDLKLIKRERKYYAQDVLEAHPEEFVPFTGDMFLIGSSGKYPNSEFRDYVATFEEGILKKVRVIKRES